MKTTITILLAALLTGCGTAWSPDRKPETPEERAAVDRMVLNILTNTPKTMSGHDQDWDDAILAAELVAKRTHCKTRLYELDRGSSSPTGRWKEVEQ